MYEFATTIRLLRTELKGGKKKAFQICVAKGWKFRRPQKWPQSNGRTFLACYFYWPIMRMRKNHHDFPTPLLYDLISKSRRIDAFVVRWVGTFRQRRGLTRAFGIGIGLSPEVTNDVTLSMDMTLDTKVNIPFGDIRSIDIAFATGWVAAASCRSTVTRPFQWMCIFFQHWPCIGC